jgi:phosphoribosyl-ATP pyrophosphohydrolase
MIQVADRPQGRTVEIVHRLLFRALVEIRAQGHEHKNKLVYHLADLFHNVVLQMQDAAEGKLAYEDILRFLEERAKEKGCERWLSDAVASLRTGTATE